MITLEPDPPDLPPRLPFTLLFTAAKAASTNPCAVLAPL